MRKYTIEQERDFAFELGHKEGAKEIQNLEEIYTRQYFRERKASLPLFLDDFYDLADMKFRAISNSKIITHILDDKSYYISYREMRHHFRSGYYLAINRFLHEIENEFFFDLS